MFGLAWTRHSATRAALAATGLLAFSACSNSVTVDPSPALAEALGPASVDRPGANSAKTPSVSPPQATTSTTAAPTTSAAPTTTEPPSRFFDDACVVEVGPADTFETIVARADDGETVNRVSVRTENGLLNEALAVGDTLDVCPGNGLDDVTGEQREDPDAEIVSAAVTANVERQQERLNELFAPFGTRELGIDGVSGPITRQHLCAARLALGFEASTTPMPAGSDEELALFAAEALVPPPMATVDQDRWALIDQTCQFMFVGAVDALVFAFPTSTGESGHQTRNRERNRAFRFDPAFDRGGWHDSSEFPVSVDNPLNGNMYKPIYFDGGQAIHGANNVPTSPQSKGCARLTVQHQDMLVGWLGLAGDTAPTWSKSAIKFTVSVQGAYVPDPPPGAQPDEPGEPPEQTRAEDESSDSDPEVANEPEDSEELAGEDDPADTEDPTGAVTPESDDADDDDDAGSGDPADTNDPIDADG
ncbi:MAG: L,D-transpeptidase [Ilumatobacter sp.]